MGLLHTNMEDGWDDGTRYDFPCNTFMVLENLDMSLHISAMGTRGKGADDDGMGTFGMAALGMAGGLFSIVSCSVGGGGLNGIEEHCRHGAVTSRVSRSGPAFITAWSNFPLSGSDLSITSGSASGGSGKCFFAMFPTGTISSVDSVFIEFTLR